MCKPSQTISHNLVNRLKRQIDMLEKESLKKSFIIFSLQEQLSEQQQSSKNNQIKNNLFKHKFY